MLFGCTLYPGNNYVLEEWVSLLSQNKTEHYKTLQQSTGQGHNYWKGENIEN